MDDIAVSGSPSDYWNHAVVLNYCNGIFLYILFSEIFIFQRFCTLADFFFFPDSLLALKLVLWMFYLEP